MVTKEKSGIDEIIKELAAEESGIRNVRRDAILTGTTLLSVASACEERFGNTYLMDVLPESMSVGGLITNYEQFVPQDA